MSHDGQSKHFKLLVLFSLHTHNAHTHTHTHTHTHAHTHTHYSYTTHSSTHVNERERQRQASERQSFAKEPYKRNYFWQKRPIEIFDSLSDVPVRRLKKCVSQAHQKESQRLCLNRSLLQNIVSFVGLFCKRLSDRIIRKRVKACVSIGLFCRI